MSHTIYFSLPVENAIAPLETLANVEWPQRNWQAALAGGAEVLVARAGSARGVAICGSEDDCSVRLFTASTRVDVDLALEIAGLFLGIEGIAAANEDEDEFETVAELTEHYDEEFRTSYVTWGANVLFGQGEWDNVVLSGPWGDARVNQSHLTAFNATANPGQALLDNLVEQQSQAHARWQQLNAGDYAWLHQVEPEAARAIVIPWLSTSFEAQTGWDLLQTLPPAVLDAPSVVPVLLAFADRVNAPATHPFHQTIVALGVKFASSDAEFAEDIANEASAAAQHGDFEEALRRFDIIVDLPRLEAREIEAEARNTASGATAAITVDAQASWMCNATWAIQADNNHMAVQTQRAGHYFERALPYAEVNPPIWLNLGAIQFELGNLEAALRFISKAIATGYDRASVENEPMFAPLRAHAKWPAALDGKLQSN